MRHIKYIFLLLLLYTSTVVAQQSPLFSLYMFNDFAINPAVAGTENYSKAQINNRYQFVGIENAPVTATLSCHTGIKKLPMGVGGIITNDSQGSFSKFGVYGAYSYHIDLDKRTKLAFGVNIGVIKYTIDMTKIVFLEEEENIDETKYEYTKPDATFGVLYKSQDYYAGLSVDQLFNNTFEFANDSLITGNQTFNKIKSHYTAVAGYNLKMSYGFELEPTIVIRKTALTPLQIEATGRITYQKTAWTGLSYRSGDAFTVLLGYNYRKMLYFAYAYDITYSLLRKDTFGSHEIMLGFRFNEKK